jgi:hypothetical protein
VIALESALRRIVLELKELHVSFALVGGLAVSIRTEPRFTKDADLAVALTSDAEAESLVRQLTTLDYRVAAVVEQEAVGRLATVRLSRADQKNIPVIDLLFASSGIESETACGPLGRMRDASERRQTRHRQGNAGIKPAALQIPRRLASTHRVLTRKV